MTLLETYRKALARPPDAPLLRAKRSGVYREITAGEFARQGEALAAGLAALGVQRGDRVGILSENRPEWLLADYALVRLGAVSVPVHATLPSAQVQAILRDAGARVLFASTASQRDKLSRSSWLARPPAVIVFEPPAARPGDRTLADLLKGDGGPPSGEDPRPEDLATLIYTSGTTGEPKGVMLTHGNLVANLTALQGLAPIGQDDVALSFLPLSHVLERIAGTYLVLLCGGIVAFAESFEALAENIREVRPTLMIGVPLFYERLRLKILAEGQAHRPSVRRLFAWGLETARRAFAARQNGKGPLPLSLRLQAALADRLVGARIRAALGGRLRLFVSGGAPLPPEVGAFFCALGLPVHEGYGLTEASPVVSLNRPGAIRLGTVGPPLPGVEVKIAADGEILVKGENVMAGYWRKGRATRAALKDGWLRTGDLGHLDEAGFLVITDRKKDLLVTAAGKKIAPRGLEERIRRHPVVRDVVVLGEGRAYLTALIVPREEALKARAAEAGIAADGDALLKDPRTELLVLGDLDRLTADCAPHEKVRRILFLREPFSLAAGEMTPTLKVRRAVVAARHREAVERLYAAEAPPRSAWITRGGRLFSRLFRLPRFFRRSA